MSRFVVLTFPHQSLQKITEDGPLKGRMMRNRVKRTPFGNNEVGANAYCKLMSEGDGKKRGDGKRRHVIDQHLKATTFKAG